MSIKINGSKTTFSALLGSVISGFRKMKAIEQSQVADKLGINQASYSRLESGKSVINIDQLYVIAEFIGVSVDDIVKKTNEYVKAIEASGGEVTAQSAINKQKTSEQKGSTDKGGAVLTGAVLGGLLVALLSNR